MHRRTLAAALLALVLLPISAQAQVTTSTVSFDGVGFTFGHELGSGAVAVQVPAQTRRQARPGVPDLEHLAFTLLGPRREDQRIPSVSAAPGVVRAYRISDLPEGSPQAQQLAALEALQATRPDPSTFTAVTEDGSGEVLPYLPLEAAPQALRARAAYVDTGELSGISYLTAFSFDASPFTRSDFHYAFQGVSADRQWYVAVDWVVTAPTFPRRLRPRDQRVGANQARFARYLRDAVSRLEAAPPETFSPPLASLDTLVHSITFAAPTVIPDSSPGPEESTAPSFG